MDFDEYRRKAIHLYFEFLAIDRQIKGQTESFSPGRLRWHYEPVKIELNIKKHFSLLADLTLNENEIITDLTDTILTHMRQMVVDQVREHVQPIRISLMKKLDCSFPGCISFQDNPNFPTRKDGKKRILEEVIANANRAKDVFVFLNNGGTHESVALEVCPFDTHSDKEAKNAARRVRQYKIHAKTLLEAVTEGPEAFFNALQNPLSKSA